MRLVRVPLRISFLGGGSDVPAHYEQHGGGVLSATIDKYIYITAKENTSLFPKRYRLVYSQVEECNNRSDIKHRIIKQLIEDYGLGSLDLDVMSDIPAGTGMGSSSAFTVGMHLALEPENSGNKYKLAELACTTEIEDLNEPIGKQDQYAAAFGGLNYFSFDTNRVLINPIHLNQEESAYLHNNLRLIYVGGTRNASKLLEEQITSDNTTLLCDMSDIAFEAACKLHRGEIDQLGPAMLEGWELKKRLSPNVSNPAIDGIIATSLKAGATGAKLLGAGGAGFVLLFCPNEIVLPSLGSREVRFTFDKEGAKVLYEG